MKETERIRWKNPASPDMRLTEREGVPFLTFPALSRLPGIRHGFSTRLGGVSQGDCATMNLSFSREESRENVEENFRRIGRAIGFSPEQMVGSMQTHTNNVRVVTGEDRGNAITRPQNFRDVDGLITGEPELALVTYYADCVPLFFVDPVHRAVGLSHSGWRGTVTKIGQETVRKMGEAFGSRPEELYAAIGPSICQDCYEVSEDVAEAFRGAFDPELWDSILAPGRAPGKVQLNLWEANRQIMLQAGIPGEQISLPGLCTCCNPTLLFSHRASQGRRGNLAAFLGLRTCHEIT